MKKNVQKGVYKDLGLIQLVSGDSLNCENLEIPFGTSINIYIEYEEGNYKNGSGGIVWATFKIDQAETIKGALQAHRINSEIIEKKLEGLLLFLIKLSDNNKINEAIDFIWRGEDGLNLKPDWHYPAGNPNDSFNKWTKNL
jgi:hypothetical protein